MKLMKAAVCVTVGLVLAGAAMADTWPPAPGQTGSITVLSANAQNGAQASLWGFYTKTGNGWVSTTFGTGTFSGGAATINYTVPADFASSFYWNVTVNYSATSDERGQYYDLNGAWEQFFTDNPNGQTVTVSVYQFDQKKVTTRSASFRASAQAGTVFPPAATTSGYVTVRRPWTGTMAEYTDSSPSGRGYYYYPKTSLLPTRLASRGYAVDVLEGDPGATQQFQKIRLHNGDYSYSVDLFGYKNLTSDDPLGYLWWTTLVDVASADCSYNEATGVFSGTFSTTLSTGVMYFVVPEFDVMDAPGSSKGCWVQAGRGTDLLLSGTSFVANLVSLDPTPASIYIKPTETCVVDLNVSNLLQDVTGLQALLGFSSDYFKTDASGPGAPVIAAGGGVWNELIYDMWNTGGDLDVAVGVDLELIGGTSADATTAVITLTPTGTEGVTQVVFRADGENGYATMFSDTAHQPVMPNKQNSVSIYIDGTAPTDVTITADPASWTAANTVTLTFSATDALSGIDHYELSIDSGAWFVASSPYPLDVSSMSDGVHTAEVKAIDKAGNEATASTNFYLDKTKPVISIDSAKQGGVELLTELGSTTNAVQGQVDIVVTASDATSPLAAPPTVTMVDSASASMTVTYDGESPTGTFHYHVVVLSTTANGAATINASVSDSAGNSESATAKHFNVNKTQIAGTVEMDTFRDTTYAFDRVVVFKATNAGGTVLKTWPAVRVHFVNDPASGRASGSYVLTDVPSGTARLSAKTAWSLRRRLAASFDGAGQATVDFTKAAGGDLLGGDLDDSNTVIILDYSILRAHWNSYDGSADINGDGQVQLLDYSIMKNNWFGAGDPP